MDPYIHTLIATCLMAGCFYLGKFFGKEDGIIQVLGLMLTAFEAREITINEDGEIILTYDDCSEETIN